MRHSPTYACGTPSFTLWTYFIEVQMKVDTIAHKYPLSPMQRGMLFHSLSAPSSGVDIEQVFCGLREDLNLPALAEAWRRVVERHDALRTSFCYDQAEQPEQQVWPDVSLPLKLIDWRSVP